jgi:ketosteroid isomerase-like protein
MKFICLGYIDESQFAELSPERAQQMMETCFDYDAELRRGGHFAGGECLDTVRHAVTLRHRGGAVQVTDGPYAETKETLGGILLLEARDLNHAIDLMSKHPGVKMGPFEIRAANEEVMCLAQAHDPESWQGAQPSDSAGAEAEIRALMAAWSRAVEAKDAAAITRDYADEAVIYDAIPPYKTVGPAALRQSWEGCLPFFPEKFRSEHRDLEIQVDGDIAFAYGVHHFVPEQADDPVGQSWLRVTVCFRRIDGKWKVVHEHISQPFNPMDNQAWAIKDPDVADMPDYSAAGCSNS